MSSKFKIFLFLWLLPLGATYTYCGQPGEFTLTNDYTTFNYCFDAVSTIHAVGFFANSTTHQYIDIPVFIKKDGCFTGITLSHLSISYMNGSDEFVCAPMTEQPIGFPQCGQNISGKIETFNGHGIADVKVVLSYNDCSPACS